MNSGDRHARPIRHLADAQLAWGMIFGRFHVREFSAMRA
jgi:hypothetical protein